MSALRALRRVLLFKPSSLKVARYYEKPKKKKVVSSQALLTLAGVSTALVGTGVVLLGSPEEQIEGLGSTETDPYQDMFVVKAYLLRTWEAIKNFKKTFSDPSSDKLLPDYLPPEFQRRYTLVMEMNDLLIHTSYDRRQGWKYQKRPGVDALLSQLFDFFEIVVFTSENAMTGANLLASLDPEGLIMYKLFKDSTKYTNGVHVKDLTNLNRPLSKVVTIDTDPKSVSSHPENSIILGKWTGDISDRTLFDLIPFLQTIAVNEVKDVRPVLDNYKSMGEDKILETFKQRQAEWQAELQRRESELLSRKSRSEGQVSTFSMWNRPNPSQVSEEGQPPLTDSQTGEVPKPPTQSWSQWIGWK